GQNTDGNGNEKWNQHGERGQLNGHPQGTLDHISDRLSRTHHADAKIAGKQVAYPAPVSIEEPVVQVPLFANQLKLFIGYTSLPNHGASGIAWHEVHHRKGEECHQEKYQSAL